MKLRKSLTFLMLTMFLVSCWGSQNIWNIENQKSIFEIEIKKLKDFSYSLTNEKSGVIQSSSDINLASEWAGYIQKIFYKEWDYIKSWTPIASIRDSNSNYDLLLEQAQNNLDLQNNQIISQEINLQNSINNAQNAYDKAFQAYRNLENQIDLKYDNIVKENNEKLKTLNDSYKNYLTSINSMMTQYLYEWDIVLWITSDNDWKNNGFETYLWAYAWDAFSIARDKWNELNSIKWEILARIDSQKLFTESDKNSDIKLLEKWFEWLRNFADKMIYMHQNNAYSTTLTPEMSNLWLQSWNNYRNIIQNSETGFIGWKNQINSFLDNYKINEEATKLAVKTIKNWLNADEFNMLQQDSELNLVYKNTSLNINNNLVNAKLALDNAKKTLETAKNLKISTLNQLKINKKNAEIALIQAQRNANKLIIKSPINWILTKINIQIGQQVNIWSIVAEMSWENAQTLVEIDPRIATLLRVGDEVKAYSQEKEIKWKITAISTIANANMLSSVRISFDNAQDLIWSWVKIIFDIDNTENNNSFLIPLNSVTIVEEWIWKIQTYKNWEIKTQEVKLWNIYWKNIEIYTQLDSDIDIILTDVSRYNNETQTLEVKNLSKNIENE